jgi:heat shock protein HtpX
MTRHHPSDPRAALLQHRWLNRLQTGLLVLTLIGIAATAGSLLFGESGLWLALFAVAGMLLLEPAAASALTLRLYRARALHPHEAPEIWALLRELSARAGLPATPVPHYVPSAVVNAFATGSKQDASIALTDGLLRSLSPRELAGVLAHEVAHIANEDLRVMGLADSVSRLTSLLAMLGQIAILLSLPALLVGAAEVYWPGLLLLAASPQLALLAQLGLSRVREFDADRLAAELTGDPHGLASALAKIERVSRSWRAWLWPGWGNPEPSWLRTHPATQERISRLLTLAPGPASALPLHAPHFLPESALATRPPRWPERAVALIAHQQETSHDLSRPVPTPRAGPLRPSLALHHRLHCRAHAAVAVPACHRGLVQSARGGRTHRHGAWRSGGGRESHHRIVRKVARLGGVYHHRTADTRCLDAQCLLRAPRYRLGLHLG